MSHRLSTAALIACLAFTAQVAQGASIIEDFESGAPDWTLVDINSASYGLGSGFSGLGGTVSSNSWDNSFSRLPGGYIVNSGDTAFDATQAISGSFNFLASSGDSRYPGAAFMMGDILSGLTTTDAGQFVAANLQSNTFGARGYIMDGTGAKVSTQGNINFSFNTWYKAEFDWTPTSGTSGVFSLTVKTLTNAVVTTTHTANVTLDSSTVHFGFGSAQPSAYGPAISTIDNINITGTEVPEPGSLALLGLGGLLVSRRRRG